MGLGPLAHRAPRGLSIVPQKGLGKHACPGHAPSTLLLAEAGATAVPLPPPLTGEAAMSYRPAGIASLPATTEVAMRALRSLSRR